MHTPASRRLYARIPAHGKMFRQDPVGIVADACCAAVVTCRACLCVTQSGSEPHLLLTASFSRLPLALSLAGRKRRSAIEMCADFAQIEQIAMLLVLKG